MEYLDGQRSVISFVHRLEIVFATNNWYIDVYTSYSSYMESTINSIYTVESSVNIILGKHLT